MVKHILLLQQGKKNKLLLAGRDKNQFSVPISDKGKRSAQRTGVWLAQNHLIPDEVISSPVERAMLTAEKSMKAMGRGIKGLRVHESLESAEIKKISKLISGLDSHVNTVMLVGNGKVLKQLTVALLGKASKNDIALKAGSLVVLSFDGDWAQREKCNLTFEKVVHPKTLPDKFPFPDVFSKTFRDRPAYYYQQSSVIPYRITDNAVEILLIKSSGRKHWVIPKGIVEPGLSKQESAAKEAFEEAGIEGVVEHEALGEYQYIKWGASCSATVYPMCVVRELDEKDWKESHRTRKWMTLAKAAEKIKQPEIVPLIKKLEENLRKKDV